MQRSPLARAAAAEEPPDRHGQAVQVAARAGWHLAATSTPMARLAAPGLGAIKAVMPRMAALVVLPQRLRLLVTVHRVPLRAAVVAVFTVAISLAEVGARALT